VSKIILIEDLIVALRAHNMSTTFHMKVEPKSILIELFKISLNFSEKIYFFEFNYHLQKNFYIKLSKNFSTLIKYYFLIILGATTLTATQPSCSIAVQGDRSPTAKHQSLNPHVPKSSTKNAIYAHRESL
jgi:hypothetical protein